MKTLSEALFNKRNLTGSFSNSQEYNKFKTKYMKDLLDYVASKKDFNPILVDMQRDEDVNDAILILPNDYDLVRGFIQGLEYSDFFDINPDFKQIDPKRLNELLLCQNFFIIYFDRNRKVIVADYGVYRESKGINVYFNYKDINGIEIVGNIFDFNSLYDRIDSILL